MDAAEILAAAGRRQADIDQRIREAEAKLKARAEARKGKPGRMTSAEQAIETGSTSCSFGSKEAICLARR